MKKILCIAGGAFVWGSEIVTLNILKGLKQKGHSVSCLTSGWNDGRFHKHLQSIGIPYKSTKLGWLYLRKPLWTLDTLLHLPVGLIQSIKILRQVPHDLIYTNSYRQISLLSPWIDKPIFYHVHDPHSKDRQFRWLLPKIDPKIKTYVAVSDFIRQDLIAAGIRPGKITVIYNGVEIPKNSSLPLPSFCKPLTLGIVGQIITRKGHEDAIEALAFLKQSGYEELRLFIVGKGNPLFEQKLKELIKERALSEKVIWRGFHHSLQEIYNGIGVLLAPTRNAEPFGLIAVEANSFKIPAIVSNKGGFPETVQHQYNGLIVPPNDPQSLAQAIAFFLNNPDAISLMGENGYKNVRNKFSLEVMQNNVAALLEE